MISLHDIEQGSELWRQLRADKYTGQNADKLLSYAAKLKIVDGVTSAYALTEITGFGGNYWTKRGHILEDEAIELYETIKQTKGYRFPNGNKVGFVTNSRYPTCGYSPDDLLPDRTLEVKAFGDDKHIAMLGGKIPLKVLAQCHFGMLICERLLCDLLVYNPKLDAQQALKIITIKSRPVIRANFKRILSNHKEVAHAV